MTWHKVAKPHIGGAKRHTSHAGSGKHHSESAAARAKISAAEKGKHHPRRGTHGASHKRKKAA